MSAVQDHNNFRQTVRAFLEANAPPDLQRKVRLGHPLAKSEIMRWHGILFEKGWAAPSWPVEHGGPGWNVAQRYIFEEECQRAAAPTLIAMGLVVVGPMIISAGTPGQKEKHLPAMLSGEAVWCQGFSEPGSGSDLASLNCRAIASSDGYVVNGTKIWTTQAHWADWCLLLVRTGADGPKQQGITVLLVDMRTPGISVRPIRTIDGEHVLNQVFFDDVAVPFEGRLGPEGGGWQLLRANIGHERLFNAALGSTGQLLRHIEGVAVNIGGGDRPLSDSQRFRDRLSLLWVRHRALEETALRLLGEPDLARRPEASLLKVRGTELQQDATRLLSEICGDLGLPHSADSFQGHERLSALVPDYAVTPTGNYLFLRKASISSGTNEIQRDIIAKSLLGAA